MTRIFSWKIIYKCWLFIIINYFNYFTILIIIIMQQISKLLINPIYRILYLRVWLMF
jgi:hypothetical protein